MRSDNPPEADLARFREIAETLYGPHPADLLADALGVNIRSVQRWLAGQNRVPVAIWDRVHALLGAQSAALEKLLGIPIEQFKNLKVVTETGIGKFGKDDNG